ncbi:MAG: hypothetical protein Q9221_007210 [Calogaya cf. arnoldii]
MEMSVPCTHEAGSRGSECPPRQLPYTVSLNGADNVGKTTQIDLLPNNFMIGKVGGLHNTDTKIGELYRQAGRLKQWWWQSSNKEFVSSLGGALARRSREGRGIGVGFQAEELSLALHSARAAFQAILKDHHLQLPKERLAILLKHGGSLEESLNITLNREESTVDDRYKLYQYLLQTEMQRQERSGEVYQHIIKIHAASSIGDVQNELRMVLLQHTGNRLFTPMLHRLDNLYVISGLSELGKRSVAEGFCSHYGIGQAFRAKIVYFNNLISEKLGKSIYDVPEKEQAQRLLHELERFSNDHYWLKIMTIESMHRHKVAKWLKTWLGDKAQVIYIDTADERRFGRALVAPEAVARNDSLKRERGPK